MEWTPPHPRRLPTAREIDENRAKIHELDAEIADLQKQLDELQRDRNVRGSFLSPFRKLPAEILSEIVLHAFEKGHSLVELSGVCAPMRDAVIGMKQIWTNIYISTERSEYLPLIHFCRNKEWLRVLLNRSAPLPLTITIVEPAIVVEMIEELQHSSALIKALSIIIEDYPQFDFSTYDLRGLQQLDLKLLSNKPFDATKLLDLIQIEGNTSFKLSLDGSGSFVRTIVEHRVFQNLVHAAFYTQSTRFLPEVPRMVFPMLETLHIASPDYLRRFELPILQSLSIEGSTSPWISDEYLLLIESIPEGITSLRIRNVILTASDLNSRQRSFGNLTKIEMSLRLAVDRNICDRFFAPQLKEVKIFWAQLYSGYIVNEEDVHLQFLGKNGLLARSPITHIHVRGIDTSSILFTSLLDTNNPILPRLAFLGLTQWSSWVDYDVEDLKHDFSLRRSNVQLSVSKA